MTRGGLLLLPLMLSACVSIDADVTEQAQTCAPPFEAATTAEVYFGRNIGPALGVTEAAWRGFLDEEVTPRFPAGLSVSDVAGQWRDDRGVIVREPSKVLMIVLSGEAAEREKLAAIRAAYRARFQQDSVLQIERRGCVLFDGAD